jgi:hypothetical protein
MSKHITQFKPGDIIKRVKPAVSKSGNTDNSYSNTYFEYIGSNEAVIVLIDLNAYLNRYSILTLDTELWGHGWGNYPTDLMQVARRKLIAIAQAILFQNQNEVELDTGKYKKGQLVKTNDNRYGFVKEIDWHSLTFINRGDYQIQFPDGVGIFRADELELVDNPPIN